MNVILIRKHKGGSGYVNLSRGRVVAFFIFVFLLLPGSLLSAGYWAGMQREGFQPDELHAELKKQLVEQRKELENAKRNAKDSINALALRLGQLQAHVVRLDSLGQRLTKMAKLDNGEFDFNTDPGQGGPETAESAASLEVPDFYQALNTLSKQLDDRSQQLSVLESILMTQNLQSEVFPAGRPIKSGWTSSYFGKRTDPFTGRRAFHYGMDFAGKEGSDVIAVASGVITWAGPRYGYGNLVEINHGNGYFTRYGHNEKVLVKVGETVEKGQRLALMGSTGRSTGPHVHFEVLYNGKPVNPEKYINSASR